MRPSIHVRCCVKPCGSCPAVNVSRAEDSMSLFSISLRKIVLWAKSSCPLTFPRAAPRPSRGTLGVRIHTFLLFLARALELSLWPRRKSALSGVARAWPIACATATSSHAKNTTNGNAHTAKTTWKCTNKEANNKS